MKLKIIFFVLAGMAVFFQNLDAQTRTPNISFVSESYNFGSFKEEGGPVSWKFEFTNIGAVPLIITNVTASCGCTSPAWSREPVLPGAKGFIAATYDPKGRPGKFEKTITVQSNADRPTVVLKISGDVIPRSLSMEEQYPIKIGDLRMKTNHIGFGDLGFGEKKTMMAEIVNGGTQPVQVGFSDVPAHLALVPVPASLKPGEKGRLEITYSTQVKNAWGFVSDRIQILQNGTAPQFNRITVSANINEDFSKLTQEQIANAPIIEFDNANYDFGTIKQGDIVSHAFIITNKGKSDLIIRDVSATCGCTAARPAETVIKPGKTTQLEARFDSNGRTGMQNKNITVITNDPKNPRAVLWIKGTVSK